MGVLSLKGLLHLCVVGRRGHGTRATFVVGVVLFAFFGTFESNMKFEEKNMY